MCVIFQFAPNATMKKEHLYNAVANNWHGFGLLIKKGNTLELIKEFDAKGTDPNKVWDLLEANKEYQRFLHVRHNTKGASTYENTQPFEIYREGDDVCFFAHNGTLNSYGTAEKSDTLEFCEKVLRPLMSKWKGDYGDSFFQQIVDKHWTGGSKGIFISSYGDPTRIGNSMHNGWQLYNHTAGESSGEVWVSNNEYFYKLSRGPIFLAAEEERKAKEEAERKARSALNDGDRFSDTYYTTGPNYNDGQSAGLKVWTNGNARSPEVIKAVNDVIDQWQLEDADDVALLNNVTFEEWEAIVRKQDIMSIAALLQRVSQHLYEVNNIENRRLLILNKRLQGKLEKATKHIATLRGEENEQAA